MSAGSDSHNHHLHYYTHRGRRRHPTTFLSRLGSGVLLPLILIFLASFLATGAILLPISYTLRIGTLLAALGTSVLRLLISYVLSILIGIPLALLVETNRRVENFFLPIYDVLESIPII